MEYRLHHLVRVHQIDTFVIFQVIEHVQFIGIFKIIESLVIDSESVYLVVIGIYVTYLNASVFHDIFTVDILMIWCQAIDIHVETVEQHRFSVFLCDDVIEIEMEA
jgi:hypothetical protein